MLIMTFMIFIITMLIIMLITMFITMLISVERNAINTFKIINSKTNVSPICNFRHTKFCCFDGKIRIIDITHIFFMMFIMMFIFVVIFILMMLFFFMNNSAIRNIIITEICILIAKAYIESSNIIFKAYKFRISIIY